MHSKVPNKNVSKYFALRHRTTRKSNKIAEMNLYFKNALILWENEIHVCTLKVIKV